MEPISEIPEQSEQEQCKNLIQHVTDTLQSSESIEFEGHQKIYSTLTEQLSSLKNIKRIDVVLCKQNFRFGFNYFYGRIEGIKEYMKIPYLDGAMMGWMYLQSGKKRTSKCESHHSVQMGKDKNIPEDEIRNYTWSILYNDEWVIPNIVSYEWYPPTSGSMPTDQFIENLLRLRKIEEVKALAPYAKQLAESYPSTYKMVENRIMDFPYIEVKDEKEECIIM